MAASGPGTTSSRVSPARGRDSTATSSSGPRPSRGRCHFQAVAVGQIATRCGCRRFWDDGKAGEGEAPNGNEPTSCACGHHACFHDADLVAADGSATASPGSQRLDRTAPLTTSTIGPLFLQVVQHPPPDSRSGIPGVPDSNAAPDGAGIAGVGLPSRQENTTDHAGHSWERLRFRDSMLTASRQQHPVPDTDRKPTDTAPAGGPSTLPPIPPQCLMSSQEEPSCLQRNRLESFESQASSGEAYIHDGATPVTLSKPSASGLGLGLSSDHRATEPLVLDATGRDVLTAATGNREIPTRYGHLGTRLSPGPASLRPHPSLRSFEADRDLIGGTPDRPSANRHLADLRTADLSMRASSFDLYRSSLPALGLPEDLIQSATEVVTPSQAGTPDLRALPGFDRTLKEFRALVSIISQGDPKAFRNESLSTRLSRRPRPGSSHDEDEPVGSAVGRTPRAPTPPSLVSVDPSRAHDSMKITRSLQQLVPCLDTLAAQLIAYPTVVTSVQLLAKRLEALENASISNGPLEDMSDRLDLMDGRVTETESKLEDYDKWREILDDDTRPGSGHALRRARRRGDGNDLLANASFTSDGSAPTKSSLISASSSALIANAMERAETNSLIASLTTRLSNLESVVCPSKDRPWQIEVVVLPWGPNLQGIWSLPDISADGQSGTEEWTQTRNSHSIPPTKSFDQAEEDAAGWDGPSIQRWANGTDDWKSPRACSTRSRVYRRLRSRGLVRDVEITRGSAKDVEMAIMRACGRMLRLLGGVAATSAKDNSLPQGLSITAADETALGLRAPYIPLRKIHRDSRLRFLTSEEMVTSALWTVEFLSSSVVMKAPAGQIRLFVTHRDGYLQNARNDSAEWTWQRLRELPRVDLRKPPTKEATPTVFEGDAREDCWEWDSKLDRPISISSSFSSDASRPSVVSLGSRQPARQALKEPSAVTSPAQSRASTPMSVDRNLPVSPMSNFPPALIPQSQERTFTRPIPAAPTASQGKRRETSREIPSPVNTLVKRRRISASPPNEVCNRGANWVATPRRSDPPSPFFSEVMAGEGRSQIADLSHPRTGGTEFAYATPYSGPVMVDNRDLTRGEDGEDDDDVGESERSEGGRMIHMVSTRAHGDEDVWEGVKDDEEEEGDEDEDDSEMEDEGSGSND